MIGDIITYEQISEVNTERRAARLAKHPHNAIDPAMGACYFPAFEYEVNIGRNKIILSFPETSWLAIEHKPKRNHKNCNADKLAIRMRDMRFEDKEGLLKSIESELTLNQAKHLARFLTEWVKEQEEKEATSEQV